MVLEKVTIKVVTHCTLQTKIQSTLIDDENIMINDDQNDILQNVPFKEQWFIAL
jgi:hypothetical protein